MPPPGVAFAVTVTGSVLVGVVGVRVAEVMVVGVPTERRKIELVVRVPSDTLSVMVDVPFCPAAGVTLTVRLEPVPAMAMLAEGTSVVLEELPVTARIDGDSSASPTVKARLPVAVPCVTLWLAMVLIVGGVL